MPTQQQQCSIAGLAETIVTIVKLKQLLRAGVGL